VIICCAITITYYDYIHFNLGASAWDFTVTPLHPSTQFRSSPIRGLPEHLPHYIQNHYACPKRNTALTEEKDRGKTNKNKQEEMSGAAKEKA
jgi:hypothetical protein